MLYAALLLQLVSFFKMLYFAISMNKLKIYVSDIYSEANVNFQVYV